MELHNRFDEAIKAKLGNLEDEPSGKVWAGVRSEVGVIRPPRDYQMPMRVAAAVALLCMVGLGFYFLYPTQPATSNGMALHERSRIKHIVIEPLDREGKKGTFLADGQPVEQQSPSPQPGRQDQHLAIAPLHKAQPKDSLKIQPNLMPLPEEKHEVIVHNEAPKLPEMPSPLIPDVKPRQNPVDQSPSIRTETAIASASSKRSYKVPALEDLTKENLRKKSGAILGAITIGANSFLGLNASYKEHVQDDQKLIAFNADFGLFKIKKVRTVKN